MKKKNLRLRVIYTGSGKWVAVAIDTEGKEVARSPAGNENEAEQNMNNYRRFGAWQKS